MYKAVRWCNDSDPFPFALIDEAYHVIERYTDWSVADQVADRLNTGNYPNEFDEIDEQIPDIDNPHTLPHDVGEYCECPECTTTESRYLLPNG